MKTHQKTCSLLLALILLSQSAMANMLDASGQDWTTEKPLTMLEEVVDNTMGHTKALGEEKAIFLTELSDHIYATTKTERLIENIQAISAGNKETKDTYLDKKKVKLRSLKKNAAKKEVYLVQQSHYDDIKNHMIEKGFTDKIATYEATIAENYKPKYAEKAKRSLPNVTAFLKQAASEGLFYHTPEEQAADFMTTLKNTPYGDMSNWQYIVMKRNSYTCNGKHNHDGKACSVNHADLSAVAFYKIFDKRVKMFIVYAGTKVLQDWTNNLTFWGNWSDYVLGREDNHHGLSAHSGFYSVYAQSYETAANQINDVIAQVRSKQTTQQSLPIDVMCLGHSLGSAAATITAVDIKKKLEDLGMGSQSTVRLFIVGTPRVYSYGSAQKVNDLLGLTNILRLVNSMDPVTHITAKPLFFSVGYPMHVPQPKKSWLDTFNPLKHVESWINYGTAYFHKMSSYIKAMKKHYLFFKADAEAAIEDNKANDFEENEDNMDMKNPVDTSMYDDLINQDTFSPEQNNFMPELSAAITA
jgi:pimeloyl-ACP methyl ester carboxylesterase